MNVRVFVAPVGTILSLLLLFVPLARAANVGQWDGSGRTWNNGEFTTIHSTLTGAGNTIEADGALTAANLANDDVFLIAEADVLLSGTETSDLSSWINRGGILWVAADSFVNVAFSNAILSGIGSTLSFTASDTGGGSLLVGGNFATNNVFDIVGESLTLSPGKSTVLGGSGTFISNDILAFQAVGAGYVFAAGDRFEHDFSGSTAATTNGKLLINVVGGATIPEPSSLAIGCGFLAIISLARGRRGERP